MHVDQFDERIKDCDWHLASLQQNTQESLSQQQAMAESIQEIYNVLAELKSVQAELRQQNEDLIAARQAAQAELAQASRMKDEFLAILSHELRTPLNTILNWSELLRTRKFNEVTTARALETIERNAKLQFQMIKQLLDVSRIIQGETHLNVCPVEIGAVIETAIDTVSLAAHAKAIQLEFFTVDSSIKEVNSTNENKRSSVIILGDAKRLQQIVWNLLSNAVKFTPTGGKIEVRLESDSNQAQITVSDTGKGISADFLPYVFDRFCQSDSSLTRSYGGLGIGLAIVRYLVELHGGTVSVESRGEGQGATFTVSLPIYSLPM